MQSTAPDDAGGDDVFTEIDLVPKSCLYDKPSRGFLERFGASPAKAVASKYSMPAPIVVVEEPPTEPPTTEPPPSLEVSEDPAPEVVIYDSPVKQPPLASVMPPLHRADGSFTATSSSVSSSSSSTSSMYLGVTVVGATNLLKVHKFGVQAPYLELKLSCEDAGFRTAEYKKGGSEAHWHQSFTRRLLSVDDTTMQLAAKASTTVIGEAFVVLRSLHLSSTPSLHRIPLMREKHIEPVGVIELLLQLLDSLPAAAACPVAPLPTPSLLDKPVEPRVTLSKVKYNDVGESSHLSLWDAPVRKGTLMFKVPYHAKSSSAPKRKWVVVNDVPKRGLCVSWSDPEKLEKAHLLALHDVLEVKTGIKTQAFRRQHAQSSKGNTFFHEDACFSLVSASRSLDLAAASKEEAQVWVHCLRKLLQHETSGAAIASATLSELKTAALSPRDPIVKKSDHTTWLHCLFDAAKRNDVSEISRFLLDGCPVDLLEAESGDTILFLACRSGNVPLLELCLKWGAKNDPHPTFGDTALQIAVKASQPECVRQLLSIAAKSDMDTEIVNHVDHANQAPLHVAAGQGDLVCLQYLLHHGADICVVQNNGFTPLHCAVLSGHDACVRYILDVGGDAILNTGDGHGNTPLHCAVSIGHEGLVKLLLESAADVTIFNADMSTPYKMARKAKLRAIQALLATYEPEPIKEEVTPPLSARQHIRDTLSKQRPTNVSPSKSLSARSNSTFEGDYDGYTSGGSASTSPTSSAYSYAYRAAPYAANETYPTPAHEYYHHSYEYPPAPIPSTEWDVKYTADGHVYYVNLYTGVSQWECPPALQHPPTYPPTYEYAPPPPAAYDSRSQYIRAQLGSARQAMATPRHVTGLETTSAYDSTSAASSPTSSPRAKTSFSERRKTEGLSVVTALPATNVAPEVMPVAAADASDIFQRSRSRSPKGKSKTIKLLDVKRSNNIVMTLSDFEFHTQYDKIAQAIIDMDESVLNLEKVRCLKNLFPTDEEKESLLKYTGDVSDFGKAEKFMLACLRVDDINTRADAFLFKLKFTKSISQVRSRIDLILAASRAILEMPAITTLLHQMLEDKKQKLAGVDYAARISTLRAELLPSHVATLQALHDLPDLSVLSRSELQEVLDLLSHGLRQCQSLLGSSKKTCMGVTAVASLETFIKVSGAQLNDVSEDFRDVKKWETKLVTEFGVVLDEFNAQEVFCAATRLASSV
ncbi:hypothetical protein SDRG_03250 [Saprolegnia diclina VS20]|uniref:WW domain-containing protein n=1 Tax=Saprolegnia diclina (strain VS20) TaxID=1156394 RepID=T0R0H0_SAPDV|nr:hypothetical protein SDRG_03250 [Saprolegnia diclina VS20]EQC39830.1 hypothetical protein SDRG_03250 [Saprolegnia diclina VS20]|eukprot:XP_008607102.1 hypothetical protein SDRG_03250 [Saprolegnia diclina VS20]